MKKLREILRKVSFPDSTYWKFTRSFVIIGLIPMSLVCILFFARYSAQVEAMTLSSLSSTTRSLEENIVRMLDSVDSTLEYVYEYETSGGLGLYEILTSRTMPDKQKDLFINMMLQEMLAGNSSISSIRMVQKDGKSNAVYYNQEKTMIKTPKYKDLEMFPTDGTYHDMILTPVGDESETTANSTDRVFSVVRNYMNVESTKSTKEDVLSSIYADINEKEVFRLFQEAQPVIQGSMYIYNPQSCTYIFNGALYDENMYGTDGAGTGLLEDASDLIQGEYGSLEEDGQIFVYRQMGDTGYYVVFSSTQERIRQRSAENLSFMIVLLIVALFSMVTVYAIYSGRLSEPARQLKRAMQEVQVGNFDVSVDIHTNDEMEYLGEGFNKMLRALKYYINQVYVARIYTNQAEIKTLKAQLRPHYLYNTLDVIRMTALDNGDRQTAHLLESLSAQMRYITDMKEELVPLSQEVESVCEYYTIVKVRYKERTRLKIDVADDLMNLYVPKLTLQPLVENAVKHGLKERDGKGTIELKGTLKEDEDGKQKLLITVMDDGVGMSPGDLKELRGVLLGKEIDPADDPKARVGIGLKNVTDLIRLNFGREYGIMVDSYENIGTIVSMRLPVMDTDGYENYLKGQKSKDI